MRYRKYVALNVFLSVLCACKKESPTKQIEEDSGSVVEESEDALMRDSIYYYYNLYSYWTASIPDYDVLRTFSTNYSSNQGVLDALMALTPTYNYATYTYLARDPGHYDRYSFIQDISTSGQLSSAGLRMDTNEGYGMYFGWGLLTSNATVAYPIVYLVEGGSPAEKAGVKRGYVVLAIDGSTDVTARINSNKTINETDYYNYNFINKFTGGSLKMKFEDLNGTEIEYMVESKEYDIDPIVADSVYTISGKKIGYLAFSSFEETDAGTVNRSNFEKVFTSFEDANVTDLILDMRYNTGGYVSTAEYLANKIVPTAYDKQLMFTYDVNDYLLQYKTGREASFADVYFSRNNNLDLKNVYVLVTEQTASAAELLINVLKGYTYLNVVLIGVSDRTYGKPVESIMSKVSLWATSFKTVNAQHVTDYWDGMSVDYPDIQDYIFYNFGDVRETMLAKAISLSTGTTTSVNRSSITRDGSTSVMQRTKVGIINKPEEKNMLKKKNKL